MGKDQYKYINKGHFCQFLGIENKVDKKKISCYWLLHDNIYRINNLFALRYMLHSRSHDRVCPWSSPYRWCALTEWRSPCRCRIAHHCLSIVDPTDLTTAPCHSPSIYKTHLYQLCFFLWKIAEEILCDADRRWRYPDTERIYPYRRNE